MRPADERDPQVRRRRRAARIRLAVAALIASVLVTIAALDLIAAYRTK